MDSIAGRWWNGKYGIARRDIWLYRTDRGWRVEACAGGERGKVWSHRYQVEQEARSTVAGMLERTVADGWRDLTKTSIEADQMRQQRLRESEAR